MLMISVIPANDKKTRGNPEGHFVNSDPLNNAIAMPPSTNIMFVKIKAISVFEFFNPALS